MLHLFRILAVYVLLVCSGCDDMTNPGAEKTAAASLEVPKATTTDALPDSIADSTSDISSANIATDTSLASGVGTRAACLFSEIVYCPKPQEQLDKYLPGWKITWEPVYLNSNHAFVATNGKMFVVAIRGSLIEFSWDAFDNWIYQDLNVAVQKDWTHGKSGMKISQGSYRGWENLSRMKDSVSGITLLEYLSKNTSAETPVVFTGHSLGGNLATVFASYYAAHLRKYGKRYQHLNVITFAAPAAGNETFAREFDILFPSSVRVENSGDIVAKFPCTNRVSSLGALYTSLPAATDIMVGYKDMKVPLSTVFETISTAMSLLEIKNGLSHFTQTNGNGTMITVKPSGKYKDNSVQSWFGEAGYQHGIAQYAAALGVPVVDCK